MTKSCLKIVLSNSVHCLQTRIRTYAGLLIVLAGASNLVSDSAIAGNPTDVEQVEFTSRELLYVPNTEPANTEQIARVRRLIANDNDDKPTLALLMLVHRVGKGYGTVLMDRATFDDVNVVDEEAIRKVTLFLPATKFTRDTDAVFTVGEADMNATGIVTQASVAWGVGCVGIAMRGTVRVSREAQDSLWVTTDLTFSLLDSETWRPSEYCSDFQYREFRRFRKTTFESLSPWEGRAQGEVSTREWWPKKNM